jgi:hypothetical protein
LAVALLLERTVLAVSCAASAAGGAWLLFQSHPVDSESGGISIRFALDLSRGVVALTCAYAVMLALASAAAPVWLCLRAPLVKSLARE